MRYVKWEIVWSALALGVFVGLVLYYFYRAKAGASPDEVTGILALLFLFGFAVIGIVYAVGRKNLRKEPDLQKRQERTEKLHRGLVKVLLLYGSTFLVFLALSAWTLMAKH